MNKKQFQESVEAIQSNINKPATLADMVAAWKFHKREEIASNEARGLVEAEILKYLRENDQELPEKGTTKLEEGLKITTGIDTKWDQEILAKLAEKWPKAGPPWPFTTEYKPDNDQIKYLQANVKAIWDRLKEACVEREKKPSFSEK
jgi:hypothetical protein